MARRGVFGQPEIIVGTWRAAREEADVSEAEVREALLQLDPLWDEFFPAEQARIVQLLVDRVDVRSHGVEVRLRPKGLAGLVREWRAAQEGCGMNTRATVSADGETITIHIPLTFRKRGGRKTVVTPDGAPWAPRPRVDIAMVKALARAFPWQRMLEEGVCGTIEELAKRERVNRGYMSRVLRLTLLAPDIVEAILDGRQPEGMRLEDLLERFPVKWDMQRVARSQLVDGINQFDLNRSRAAVQKAF